MMTTDEPCEHEIDFSGPTEYGDLEDCLRWRACCLRVKCKKCGAEGFCVDDTGDFWEGEDY